MKTLCKSVERVEPVDNYLEPMPLVTTKRYEVEKSVKKPVKDYNDTRSMELLEKALIGKYKRETNPIRFV